MEKGIEFASAGAEEEMASVSVSLYVFVFLWFILNLMFMRGRLFFSPVSG